MRKYNHYVIIGVDAGYGNMKTARTMYPTGLAAMDSKPIFDGDILEWNGSWYRMDEGHKAFNPDKTTDEDFYLLTLASVACELRVDQITAANVHLAVGLPTTWTGRQRESYRNDMLRSRELQFVFNGVQYSIHLMDCSVFPQGYAAMVPLMDNDKRLNGFRNFMGTVMMADIGNGTMKYHAPDRRKAQRSALLDGGAGCESVRADGPKANDGQVWPGYAGECHRAISSHGNHKHPEGVPGSPDFDCTRLCGRPV